ncbi:hypothetical protein [Candidatus Harpocratesius sp.]
MRKLKNSIMPNFRLNRDILIVFIILTFFSISFFEVNQISCASAFSSGLKPGDTIVYEYSEINSYYNSNMTLLDFYDYSDQIIENITDVRYFNDRVEIDYIFHYDNTEVNLTGVLNSTLPLGTYLIPQEYIGFNFSHSSFLTYLNFLLNRTESPDDSPEGVVTWNHEILANGLGFQINANYTNYKYNCTKEYNLTVCLYYSRSGVLLRRIEEFRVKFPPNYSIDNTAFWILNRNTFVNTTLSNFEGKDECPWDPNYVYPDDLDDEGDFHLISLNPLEFVSIFIISILFLIKNRKIHRKFVINQ